MVPLFRWLSSVRLAVPLLLTLAAVVAVGTVLESLYSAGYARLLIYQTFWFYALMGILGLNILCAALSRWPWQKRHTGFVVTHFGMLLMLSGSLVTAQFGIDGELSLEEGATNAQVGLPALEMRLIKNGELVSQMDVPRWASARSENQLRHLNIGAGVKFVGYEPFTLPDAELAKAEDDPSAAPALSFWLRSQFFNTSEWLHAKDRPQVQMGPATLRLVIDQNMKAQNATAAEATLRILQQGKVIRSIAIQDLMKHPVKLGDVKITYLKSYETASVVGNKLVEKGGGAANPAVELQIQADGQKWREISFANFKDFSLRKDEGFPYRFEYSPTEQRGQSNLIEFHFRPSGGVGLELYKRGQLVLKEDVTEGSSVQTPWMGMKITMARILDRGVMHSTVKRLESPGKGALAPSAFAVLRNGEKFWLMEGESHDWSNGGDVFSLSYGPKQMTLPFALRLNKFIKQEYPGTTKALSFESHVVIPETNRVAVISMNEPLVQAGFTLYQASFQAEPGRLPVSVLSVNRDPGRELKYLGGLVTSLGILLYTLMRSRMWWRKAAK